ncbi:sulfite exporter TauE/SafE family protein [Shimia sp. FJ5]|uniref:sulfite exporter TauE/SafE family protein n=1 Tax=Shimia sp. FJ5 TaxID=3079054 RepID=UPI00263107B4|nr:sulfite exporter TauE/SafE family protein [Shimia sp. FJ5]MDV4145071.1 sulfite exporter TauE/SafE family protein [Shimia sp. FJ5]
MNFDLGFFAIAAPAVVFAGVSKGGFGSGAAFASAAILALVLPPTEALGLMLPLLMLIDLATLRPYWKRWSWPDAKVLIAGGLPGVALGVALMAVANEDVLRFLIGAVALGFVIWRLWPGEARHKALPVWAGALAGVAAGFTSFISHAGGPPVAVYLLSRGVGKTAYQATTVLIFWIINIAKAVPYAVLGVFTLETLWLDLWLAPFALIGAWLGVRAHDMVSERVFFGLTYVLLSLTGARLIWDAVI